MSSWITTCVDHIATARSRDSYLRAAPYLLMGWSGHAHTRSAIEADKGHQRRRARHVAVGSLAGKPSRTDMQLARRIRAHHVRVRYRLDLERPPRGGLFVRTICCNAR